MPADRLKQAAFLQLPDLPAFGALPGDAWVQRDLDPLYLRPCDAVDNLASIAAKRGQAPEEALAQLDRLLGPAPEDVIREKA